MAQRRQVPLRLTEPNPLACSRQLRLDVLAELPFLAGLTPDELAEVNRRFGHRHVEVGEVVHRADTPARHLHVVAIGAVKATRVDRNGRTTLLDLFTPGDFLGALPALGQQHYSETATALASCCLLVIDAHEYDALLQRFPVVARSTLRGMSRRLTQARAVVHLMAGATLEQRLAAALLFLAGKVGEPWRGETLLQVPLSRDDLAAMTGAATESVSRVLSAWRRDGIVDAGRRWIAIADPGALSAVRDG